MPDNDPGVLAREIREMADTYTVYDPYAVVRMLRRAADYLESRAPVGVTVGEPALTRLEEENKRLRQALTEVMQWIAGWDPNFIYDDEWPATSAKVRALLQANGVSGSPTSPKQTSELEEALANGSLMK